MAIIAKVIQSSQRSEVTASPIKRTPLSRPSPHFQPERHAIVTRLPAADGGNRFDHPARAAEELVGDCDEAPIGGGGGRRCADRLGDLGFTAGGLKRTDGDEGGG